jgi:hypothetical protein
MPATDGSQPLSKQTPELGQDHISLCRASPVVMIVLGVMADVALHGTVVHDRQYVPLTS